MAIVHHPQPTPTAAFLAWPAASSLIFLLSAASLLGGVWGVLAPGLEDVTRTGERFAAVGILHLYQLALLAVGALLCRWRAGNPDAIGIAVLAACFAIGSAAGLDTVAIDRPGLTLALGALGLPLLAVGGWWLVRRMLGRIEPALAIAAGALIAWHALAPGWMGWSFTAHLDDTLRRDPQGPWLSGLWLAAVVAAALLPIALRFSPDADRGQPFLRRAGMGWIVVLVVLAAGVLHLLMLDHLFTLERGVGACLVPLALIALVGNELRRRTWGDSSAWDVVAVGAPCLAALIASINAGPGSEAWLSAAATPAAVPLVVGVAALALGRTRAVMIDLGLGALLLAVLTWGGGPGWYGLGWSAFLLATPIALVLLALRRRRHEFALGAVLVGSYALVMHPEVAIRLIAHGLAPVTVLMLVAGAGVLVLGVCLAVGRGAMQWAAWAFALGGYHCGFRIHIDSYGPAVGLAFVAVGMAGSAWARRDALLLAPLALPAAELLLRLRAAWLGIGGAFALLAGGAWLSWRRLHHEPAPVSADPDDVATQRLTTLP